MFRVFFLLIITFGAFAMCPETIPYCNSTFLHPFQTSKLYNDSKHFVDMPMRFPPQIIYEKFSKLPSRSPDILRQFIKENFDEPGSEMESITPTDWVSQPAFLHRIQDPQFRRMAVDINNMWKVLVRRFNHDKYCSTCYSSLDIKHPFVVPGGRFREFYYWDSYWVIEGLLISQMYVTAKNHIQNMLDLVNKYGFIPNGGRVYYLNRSQPPFLTLMVWRYFQVTRDEKFLREALPTLDKEYSFWMKERLVKLNRGELNVYRTDNKHPRPESYIEDLHLAEFVQDKETLYANIAAAAESGWDFSSRWFRDDTNRYTTQTNDIIPVDLNAIMYRCEVILSDIHKSLGNEEQGTYYATRSRIRLASIEFYLWSPSKYQWFDYNYVTKKQNERSYASNFVPLWAKAYPRTFSDEIKLKIMRSLSPLTHSPAGIPMSLRIFNATEEQEQWDFPNSWAPIEDFIIEGLNNLDLPESRSMARDIGNKWIGTAFCAWKKTGLFFEKYNVTKRGYSGSGGEYPIQTGFGWTNGVILMILSKYSEMSPLSCDETTMFSSIASFGVLQIPNLLILTVIVLSGVIVILRLRK